MKSKRLTKKCLKCGRTQKVRPRERRCHVTEDRFGTKYFCWGKLERVKTPKPKLQTAAQQKLERARKNVEKTMRAITRNVTSLRMWQNRVRRYEKLAVLTDEQVAAAQAAREARARARREGKRRKFAFK